MIEGFAVTACEDCHYPRNLEPAVTTQWAHNPASDINQQWANSAHGGHIASAPATKTTAPGWTYYNWDQVTGTGQRADCQRCHTATGAKNFFTAKRAGTAYVATSNTFPHLEGWTAATGSPQNELLYCWGCHSDVPSGELRNPGAIVEVFPGVGTAAPAATVTFPNIFESNLCLGCHIGRQVGQNVADSTSDFSNRSFINSHYLAAGGTVFNESGYEYVNSLGGHTTAGPYNIYGFHKQVGWSNVQGTGNRGPCVTCHMTSAEGHTFSVVQKDGAGVITSVASTACGSCHADMTPTTLNATQDEFAAALEELRVALANRGVHFFEAHPYFYAAPYVVGGTNTGLTNWNGINVGTVAAPITGRGKDVMGAAFNYNLLKHDPGAYAHNSGYALKLIVDSLDFLNDGTVNNNVTASAAFLLLSQGINIFDSPNYATIHDVPVPSAVANPQGSAVTCSACHAAAPHYGGSLTAPRAAQWVSTELNCASCHANNNIAANQTILSGFADSRHGDVKGPGWIYSGAFGSSCQRCHTSRGFIANLNDGVFTFGATDSHEVLTCNACHTSVVDGSLRAAGAYTAAWSQNSVTASVSFPDAGSSNLCIRCHSARRAGANITNLATTTAHYLPAATIVYGGTLNLVDITATANGGFGTDQFLTGGGYEFDGQIYSGLNAHSGVGGAVRGPCVTCHMSGAAGHSWKPVVNDEATGQVVAVNSTACVACHDGVSLPLMTPEVLNAKKAQLNTALTQLEAQLNARDIYYNDGSFYTAPYVTGGTNTTVNNAYYTSKAGAPFPVSVRNLQGAAYNLWLFKYHGADPAGYAHNPGYALKLVSDSADLLNDGAINGL